MHEGYRGLMPKDRRLKNRRWRERVGFDNIDPTPSPPPPMPSRRRKYESPADKAWDQMDQMESR